MSRYRKKPVSVDAIRFTGANLDEVIAFTGYEGERGGEPGDTLVIETLEGDMTARPGDWIVKGVMGECYPCRADIFDLTYEPDLTEAPT